MKNFSINGNLPDRRISNREKTILAITVLIIFATTTIAISAVGLDSNRLAAAESISIVGYTLLMIIVFSTGHLSVILFGDPANELAGLDKIGIFLGLTILTIISIPLMMKFSKGIHVVRRTLYVWISVTQLSLVAFLYIGVLARF